MCSSTTLSNSASRGNCSSTSTTTRSSGVRARREAEGGLHGLADGSDGVGERPGAVVMADEALGVDVQLELPAGVVDGHAHVTCPREATLSLYMGERLVSPAIVRPVRGG